MRSSSTHVARARRLPRAHEGGGGDRGSASPASLPPLLAAATRRPSLVLGGGGRGRGGAIAPPPASLLEGLLLGHREERSEPPTAGQLRAMAARHRKPPKSSPRLLEALPMTHQQQPRGPVTTTGSVRRREVTAPQHPGHRIPGSNNQLGDDATTSSDELAEIWRAAAEVAAAAASKNDNQRPDLGGHDHPPSPTRKHVAEMKTGDHTPGTTLARYRRLVGMHARKTWLSVRQAAADGVLRWRLEHRSARTLQHRVRVFLGRRCRRLVREQQTHAAMMVQGLWRRLLARRELAMRRRQRADLLMRLRQLLVKVSARAASTIQGQYRRHQLHQQVQEARRRWARRRLARLVGIWRDNQMTPAIANIHRFDALLTGNTADVHVDVDADQQQRPKDQQSPTAPDKPSESPRCSLLDPMQTLLPPEVINVGPTRQENVHDMVVEPTKRVTRDMVENAVETCRPCLREDPNGIGPERRRSDAVDPSFSVQGPRFNRTITRKLETPPPAALVVGDELHWPPKSPHTGRRVGNADSTPPCDVASRRRPTAAQTFTNAPLANDPEHLLRPQCCDNIDLFTTEQEEKEAGDARHDNETAIIRRFLLISLLPRARARLARCHQAATTIQCLWRRVRAKRAVAFQRSLELRSLRGEFQNYWRTTEAALFAEVLGEESSTAVRSDVAHDHTASSRFHHGLEGAQEEEENGEEHDEEDDEEEFDWDEEDDPGHDHHRALPWSEALPTPGNWGFPPGLIVDCHAKNHRQVSLPRGLWAWNWATEAWEPTERMIRLGPRPSTTSIPSSVAS